jgi:hypothetical protein
MPVYSVTIEGKGRSLIIKYTEETNAVLFKH